MAHYVKIVDNVVTENIVVHNSCELDENGQASEAVGVAWVKNFKNDPDGTWLKTSFNSNRGVYYKDGTNVPHEDQSKLFRKTFAEVGFEYDPDNDWFKPKKYLDSFVWSDEHWDYRPPQAVPDDGQQYDWNENQYQSTGNGWVVRSE